MPAEDILPAPPLEPISPPEGAPIPSDEDIFGPPTTGARGDIFSTLPGAAKQGFFRGLGTGVSALSKAGGVPVVPGLDEAMSAEPNAIPGQPYVNVRSPFYPAAEAAGQILPAVGSMLLPGVGEAAAPAFIGESLLRGPAEARLYNEQLARMKAQNPDDPTIQAMPEKDPAAEGLKAAAGTAAFMKLGPAVGRRLLPSTAAIESPLLRGAAQFGNEALSNAYTAAALDFGTMTPEEFSQKYGDRANALSAIFSAAGFALPGGVHARAEAARQLGLADFAKVTPHGDVAEPPKPKTLVEQAPATNLNPLTTAATEAKTAVEAGPPEPAPVALPAEGAPAAPPAVEPGVHLTPDELAFQQRALKARQNLRDADPADLARMFEENQNPAERALIQQEMIRRLAEKPAEPAQPVQTPSERRTMLQAELGNVDEPALIRIQELAQTHGWSDDQFDQALTEALQKRQTPEPTTQDEQKGSSEKVDVRGQAEQPAAQEPDAQEQLRTQPGNADVEPGTGDQVRQQRVERPGAEEAPVRQPLNEPAVSAEPNAGGKVRRKGKQRAGAKEQPVLTAAEQVLPAAEEPVKPRKGSLADNPAAVVDPQEAAAARKAKAGKKVIPKREIADIEADLHDIAPEALAELQQENAVAGWDEKQYKKALNQRLYREQKEAGQVGAPKEEPLPAKAKVAEVAKKPPKKRSPEQIVKDIEAKQQELRDRADAAEKAGDQATADRLRTEAADWEPTRQMHMKPAEGTPEKAQQDLKANMGANRGAAAAKEIPPGQPRSSGTRTQAAINEYRAQFPDAPDMVSVHSDNLQHILDPDTYAKFQKADSGDKGKVRAFADPNTGRVYLLHDRLYDVSPKDLRMIMHEETFGHLGIEGALKASGGNDAFRREMDIAFNRMVAEKGPLALDFVKRVGEYVGAGADPHEVVKDDELRRQVMAEVVAHNAGKYLEKGWVNRAWTGLKGILGKATGVDLNAREDYMQRLVDAGAKHLKERAAENWQDRNLEPGERADLRANRAENLRTAELADDSIPFRDRPKTNINQPHGKITTARPEDDRAGRLLAAVRRPNGAARATLETGQLDRQRQDRQLQLADRAARAQGIDVQPAKEFLKKFKPYGEHSVTYDQPSNRWFKLTRAGTTGGRLVATPDGSLHLGANDLQGYLQDIVNWNDYFGDDRRVHGIMTLPSGRKSVVTSQPNYQPIDPIPDPFTIEGQRWKNEQNDKIREYFRRRGFEQIANNGQNGMTFYHPTDKVVLSDMKPYNVMEVARPNADGPVMKIIDGTLNQGADDPVVQRAHEHLQEIHKGLRDPENAGDDVGTLINQAQKQLNTMSDIQGMYGGQVHPAIDQLIQLGLIKKPGAKAPTVHGTPMDTADWLDSLRANRAPVTEEQARQVDTADNTNYSRLDAKLAPRAVQTGPSGDPASDALAFLQQREQGRAELSQSPRSPADKYRDQAHDLLEWAQAHGRLLTPADLRSSQQGSNHGGGEHDAFFDPATQRWLKNTMNGDLGHLPYVPQVHREGIADNEPHITNAQGGATPIDYLQRLVDANDVFGDAKKFHGVTTATGRTVNIITSQPHYEQQALPPGQAGKDMKQIQRMVIEQRMKDAGFIHIGHQEWFHPEHEIVAMDVRPANVAISNDWKRMMPFDVITSSNDDPKVLAEGRRMAERVQQGLANFDTKPPIVTGRQNELPQVRHITEVNTPDDLNARASSSLRANRAPVEQASEKFKDYARVAMRRQNEDVKTIRDALRYGLDARDNIADNSGVRAENDVAAHIAMEGGNRVKNSKEAVAEREAVLPLVEAGFGGVTDDTEYAAARDKLLDFQRRVNEVLAEPQPTDPDALSEWQKRQAAAERLKAPTDKAVEISADQEKTTSWSGKVKAEFDAQQAERMAAGMPAKYFENYVKRVIEADPNDDSAFAMPMSGGGGAGFDRSENQARRFETVYDAMENGKKLAAMDVAGLVGAGQVSTAKMLGNQELFDRFKNMEVPGAGRPVLQKARKIWNPLLDGGKGGWELKAPGPQYAMVTGPTGERFYVDKEFSPYFTNMLKESYVRNNAALSALLHTAADMKHGILLFDTFHVGRVMARLANLLLQSRGYKAFGHLDIPAEILQKLGITETAKYGKGRAALDFRADTLDAAEQLGWISPKDRQWAEQNQQYVKLAEESGYNVAGNLDNLYERAGHGLLNQFLHKLGKGEMTVGNGIETFNKWVFQKLTRNAMMIGWKEAFERNAKRFPELSEKDVARRTSQEMNEYFGNLGRQGVFQTATAQDVARLAFLAPQWANSMIASQIRGAKQFATFGGKLLHGERAPIGNVAGAMGAGFVAMLAANQVINLLTKHQPTWENEDGHKLDAFIPGGKNGFYLNPASIVAEELHTLMRYKEGGESLGGATGRIVLNKASPYARAAAALFAGVDSMGRPIAPGKRGEVAIRSLNPLPIFSSAATGSLLNPEMSQKGDAVRQLLGMGGLKLERAQGPGQKLRAMAKDIIPDQFPKAESPGEYAKLRAYINNENDSKAKDEILDLLRAGKTLPEISRVFAQKPIGRSYANQGLFLRRAGQKALDLLPEAAKENAGNASRLAQILQSIPQQELQDAVTEAAKNKLE